MPHLAQDLLSADPDALARLRKVLHGDSPSAPAPCPAERFGEAAAAGQETPSAPRPRRRKALASP